MVAFLPVLPQPRNHGGDVLIVRGRAPYLEPVYLLDFRPVVASQPRHVA